MIMEDGWYRVTHPKVEGGQWFTEVNEEFTELFGEEGMVEELVEHGYKFEPAVCMTKAEFDAAMKRSFEKGYLASGDEDYETDTA